MRRGLFDGRVAGAVVLLAMAPALAQAYIDPGSGAYMVQALFTVVAAGLFYARHPLRTLKSIGAWLTRRKKPAEDRAGGDASLSEIVNGAVRVDPKSDEV